MSHKSPKSKRHLTNLYPAITKQYMGIITNA